MRLTLNHLNEYIKKCRLDGQNEDTLKVKHRNLRLFIDFCADREITAALMSRWRDYITERYTKAYARINMVCKTNVFLEYLEMPEFKIKSFDVERRKLHSKSNGGVTMDELKLMLAYTKETDNARMNLLLRVLAVTGIRSGEIQHITAEAVNAGFSEFIHHKNPRKVLLPEGLRRILKEYADSQGITAGPVFITRNGNPVHQRGIGAELKKIAENAGIPKDKINPTAFRILFANTYYEKYGDLSGLTDLLGVKDLSMSVLYVTENGGS